MQAPQTAQAPPTAPRPHGRGAAFPQYFPVTSPVGNATPPGSTVPPSILHLRERIPIKAPFAQKNARRRPKPAADTLLQLVLILSCDGHADLSQRVLQRALRFRTTTAAGIIPQLITAKATHSITLLVSPVSGGVVGLGSVVPESPGLGSGLGSGLSGSGFSGCWTPS